MKADRTEYIMYNFIYAKLKKIMLSGSHNNGYFVGWGGVVIMGEWSSGNVLLPDLSTGYTGAFSCEKLSSYTFMMCTFLFLVRYASVRC